MKTFILLCCLVSIATSVPADQKKKSLSDQPHEHENGEHNPRFDHEAFLGEEQAAEFYKLPLEESKRRLRIIFGKIDTDNDGYVTHEELTNWVIHVSHRRLEDSVKLHFPQVDQDGDGKISWNDLKKATFGTVEDIEGVYDERRGLTYKDAISRNERRFKASDKNKDNILTEEEYMAYLHPDEFEHTKDVHIQEAFDDMDTDKDGGISLEEYLEDIWPTLDRGNGAEEPEWVRDERKHFSEHRDHDNDNKLNKRELADWISPDDYNPADAEASHLIYQADSDKDDKLSIKEVMDNYSLFVGSHATEFGGFLTRHDEF